MVGGKILSIKPYTAGIDWSLFPVGVVEAVQGFSGHVLLASIHLFLAHLPGSRMAYLIGK